MNWLYCVEGGPEQWLHWRKGVRFSQFRACRLTEQPAPCRDWLWQLRRTIKHRWVVYFSCEIFSQPCLDLSRRYPVTDRCSLSEPTHATFCLSAQSSAKREQMECCGWCPTESPLPLSSQLSSCEDFVSGCWPLRFAICGFVHATAIDAPNEALPSPDAITSWLLVVNAWNTSFHLSVLAL